MPNWVQNRLTVKGKDADKILKQYLIEDKSEMNGYSFDFNKIKEMPESLKIVSGSITDDCLKVYLSSIPLNDYFDEAKLLVNAELFPTLTASGYARLHENEVNELVQRCLDYGANKPNTIEDPSFKTKDDVIAYGKIAMDNVKNYGSKDWYNWCVKNWGTKWNACDTFFDEEFPTEIMFQTAWSDVKELIAELSKKHPENAFFYEYSEEQIGNHAGMLMIQNGEYKTVTMPNDYTKEAYEIAFDLWGDGTKECFKFNEETNNYEFIDEDESEDNDDAEM